MPSNFNFHVYIDEFGDEGFGKLRSPNKGGQSSWFMIGGIIVINENDKLLPKWRDEILCNIGRDRSKVIHFKKLKHEQKVAACRILSSKPIGVCVVASNKETILNSDRKSVFKNKGYLYNYLTRYILERVTRACRIASNKYRIQSPKLKVCFSRRRSTNYDDMRKYLYKLRNGDERMPPTRTIDWNVFDPDSFIVENHSKRAGLQIADIVTSAVGRALEPNKYGDIEPRYALLLRPRFLRRNKKILGEGLTLLPPPWENPLTEEQRSFLCYLES